MKQIGTPMKRNYLSMIFASQQGTDYQYTFIMNWMTKIMIIAPRPTNNDVTFCPPWKDMCPLRQRQPILIAIYPQRCRIRRKQGLESYLPTSIRVIKSSSTMVPIITECSEIRLKCLSASGNRIYLKLF